MNDLNELIKQHARRTAKGVKLNHTHFKLIPHLQELPDNYIQLIEYSNGIYFNDCTLPEGDGDPEGFCFGYFFSWQQVVDYYYSSREFFKEYNLLADVRGDILCIGETYESKAIALGVGNRQCGQIFLLNPSDFDPDIKIYKLAESLRDFLYSLKPCN